MTPWMVLACILAALFLLSLIRIGAKAEYSADGLTVRVKAGPFSLQLFPAARRKPKGEKKKKREPPREEAAHREKKGGSFDLIREMLPLAAETAGRFKRKLRIDRLYLDFTAAASDPSAAAMAFGYANAAVGMIWPLLEHNFDIKERRIRTKVDFQMTAPAVYLYLEASLRLGQALVLGAGFFLQFIIRYKSVQKKQSPAGEKQKEAV